MADELIKGKVAAIITRRELALNVGADDGVTPGMRFLILNSKGIGVKDPDTGELLGDVPAVKTIVKVVKVAGAHLSTARTFRTIPGKPGLADALMSGALSGRPSRPETLTISPDRSDLVEMEEEDSYVKIGDPAVQAVGDDYDDFA